MARAALLALLLLLAAFPPASAGTEKEPEIVDSADVDDASADVRAAWVEATAKGLRFTVKLTSARTLPPDHVWWFRFVTGGQSFFAAVGTDGQSRILDHEGSYNGPEWNRGGLENAANGALLDPGFAPGTPAYVTGTIPWGHKGLKRDSVLIDLGAGATLYHRSSNQWQGGYDTASTPSVVALGQVAKERAGNTWAWALTGALVMGGVAGGAAWWARRRA